MAFKFNPFSGTLDFVNPTQGTGNITNAETAEKVADVFNCPGTAVVGDLVIPSTTTTDLVEPVTTNVYDNLVMGVIIEKLSATTCKVLVSGKLAGATYSLSGLDFGKPVFVGTNGKLTTTVPLTGHKQKMGLALKADTVFLLPSLEKVAGA